MTSILVSGQRFGSHRLGRGLLSAPEYLRNLDRLAPAEGDRATTRQLLEVELDGGGKVRLDILVAEADEPSCFSLIALRSGRPITTLTTRDFDQLFAEAELLLQSTDKVLDRTVFDQAFRARITATSVVKL
jgi:hypothetical protein